MESKSLKSEADLLAPLRKLRKAKTAYERALAQAQDEGPAILKQLRQSLGITQADFAKILNRHPIHLNKLETGSLRPGLHLLLSLLDLPKDPKKKRTSP